MAYLFDKRGVIVVDADALRRGRPDARHRGGRQDIAVDDDVFEIITEPARPHRRARGAGARRGRVESAEVTQRPKTRVPIDEDAPTKLMRLIDALEDNDDVDDGARQFDVDAAVLERVAGS